MREIITAVIPDFQLTELERAAILFIFIIFYVAGYQDTSFASSDMAIMQTAKQTIYWDGDVEALMKPWYAQKPPHSKWLKNVSIFLDPGHGGQHRRAGYKRGPNGLREAEINLAVALMLKYLLEQSGAKVYMSREKDEFVSLHSRVDMANSTPVDLFVSLHHNASSRNTANYVSTWYHNHVDHRPASINLASSMARRMAETLRLEEYIAQELYSDHLLYSSGFGVLRNLEMPSCLMEASFFTHPEQECRLRNPEYLAQEAWGYYLGLADYAADSWPTLKKKKLIHTKGIGAELKFNVADGINRRGGWKRKEVRIFSDSIKVRIDNKVVKHSYDSNSGMITVKEDNLPEPGEYRLDCRMSNLNGSYDHDASFNLIIRKPLSSFRITTPLSMVKPGHIFPLIVAVQNDEIKASDGVMPLIQLKSGNSFRIISEENTLHDGKAVIWLSIDKPYKETIIAEIDGIKTEISIVITDTAPLTISGIMNDKRPLSAKSSIAWPPEHLHDVGDNRFFAVLRNDDLVSIRLNPADSLPVNIYRTKIDNDVLDGKEMILSPKFQISSKVPGFLPEKVTEILNGPPHLYIHSQIEDDRTVNKAVELLSDTGRSVQVVKGEINDKIKPFSWLVIIQPTEDLEGTVFHKKWDDTDEYAARAAASVLKRITSCDFAVKTAKSSEFMGFRRSALIIQIPAELAGELDSKRLASLIMTIF